jgi:hypothetical protein
MQSASEAGLVARRLDMSTDKALTKKGPTVERTDRLERTDRSSTTGLRCG